MKSYLQVQRDRIKYHLQPFKNTVHRSSLTAPNLKNCDTWISFINHFLLKRNYTSVALKLSAVDKNGDLLDSVTIKINKPILKNFLQIFSFFKIPKLINTIKLLKKK